MRRSTILGLLALAALCAAFGAPSHAAAQTPQQVQLTLQEFMITPMSFTVTAGQPVHFVVNNTGKFPHSVTFVHGTTFITLFKTPLKGGTSGEADFTFMDAGTWQMYCPVGQHAEAGMTGQVTVLTAGAPGMPTTGLPSEGLLALLGLLALALLGAGAMFRRVHRLA